MKKIKISSFSIIDIIKLKESEDSLSLIIENSGIKKEKMEALNEVLEARDDFLVDISSDRYFKEKDNVSGIDLISLIPNAKNIRVQASLREPLYNLEIFSSLNDLRQLFIYGNLQRGIILDPLKDFINLEGIQIENGFTLRQQTFLETRKNLKFIEAAEFNAFSFNKNPSIKRLKTSMNILGMESLPRALPNLEELYLENCHNVYTFNPLNEMNNLKIISLKNINRIKAIPELANLKKLETLIISNLKNLTNIDAIFNIENLKKLIAKDLSFIKAKDFIKLDNLKSLKYLTIDFKDLNENKLIENMTRGKGYISET